MLRTCLYDFHIARNAKMVDFAGYAMPVLYQGQSHIESHNWVRQNAGLFDVSHMVQHKFSGPDSLKLLEKVTPTDLKGLKPFQNTLSVLLNENAGIVDDSTICRHDDEGFFVITNAGTREKDLKFFKDQAAKLGLKPDHTVLGGGLIALQGPKAAETLQKFTTTDLKTIKFGEAAFIDVLGTPMHFCRGGYTGEDGFEISIRSDEKTNEFAEALCTDPTVKPIGLAARDSLRLEAGMCLYGHDLNDQTTPVAGRLAWTVAKSRRKAGEFNGAEIILQQLKNKDTLIRTGLTSSGPAPREGCEVVDPDGNVIGVITSGSLGPTVGKNVAMAYLPRKYAKSGQELGVIIRGKGRPAVVASMPFIETRYYK